MKNNFSAKITYLFTYEERKKKVLGFEENRDRVLFVH